jgi:hypothetical protein
MPDEKDNVAEQPARASCVLCGATDGNLMGHPSGQAICERCARIAVNTFERAEQEGSVMREMHRALVCAYVTAELMRSEPRAVLPGAVFAAANRFAAMALGLNKVPQGLH